MTKNKALQTRAEVSNLRECERAEIKPLADTPGGYGVSAVWADGTGREFFTSRDEFAAWVEKHFVSVEAPLPPGTIVVQVEKVPDEGWRFALKRVAGRDFGWTPHSYPNEVEALHAAANLLDEKGA